MEIEIEDTESELINDAMRLVFQYCSINDLRNTSLTCRSWLKLVKEEIQLRGPRLIEQEVYIIRWDRIAIVPRRDFKRTDRKPHLLLCFTNKDCNSNVVKEYYKKLKPKYCNIGVLKRHIFEDVNKLWTLVIPYSRKIKVAGFTFATPYSQGLRCIETTVIIDDIKSEYLKMRSYFQTFIDQTPQSNVCLILFCKYNNMPYFMDMMKHLATWFPNVGPIWGGTLYLSELCYKADIRIPVTCSRVNIVQIFISGNDMLTKYLIFDKDSDTKEKILKKYQDLRDTIKLRENTVAFLCTPVSRYNDFYKIESAMFKEVFPNVTLAQIFSNRPFGANNLEEFQKHLLQIKPNQGNNNSVFLLISYNN